MPERGEWQTVLVPPGKNPGPCVGVWECPNGVDNKPFWCQLKKKGTCVGVSGCPSGVNNRPLWCQLKKNRHMCRGFRGARTG